MLLTYTATFPGTCSSLWVLTFEFLHLLTRWRNERTMQHFCSYEGKKTQHISNFSSRTQLPKFKSVNIFFPFLKVLEEQWVVLKRKQKTKQQRNPNHTANTRGERKQHRRREDGNKQQLSSPPGKPPDWIGTAIDLSTRAEARGKAARPPGNRSLCCAASPKPFWSLSQTSTAAI